MLVHNYERARWPVPSPDPIEAIELRMEQQGLTRKDLLARADEDATGAMVAGDGDLSCSGWRIRVAWASGTRALVADWVPTVTHSTTPPRRWGANVADTEASHGGSQGQYAT
jgi:hypothetical protein